jgi:predicted RNA-binding Zn-ribbon protein involved in translation (DUF1610 family)
MAKFISLAPLFHALRMRSLLMGGIYLLLIAYMRLNAEYRAPLIAAMGETGFWVASIGGCFALIIFPATFYFLIERRHLAYFSCPNCKRYLLELQFLWKSVRGIARQCRRFRYRMCQFECPHCGELIDAVKPSWREYLFEYAFCFAAMLGPVLAVKIFW